MDHPVRTIRSGGGCRPVSKYVRNVFSSSVFGFIPSEITRLIPRIISSCPLYPIANIQVIFDPSLVFSIASRRRFLISAGTSQRSPTISSDMEFLISFSTNFGILVRNSWNIPAISISDRSSIFSFESAHILTYLIWFIRQSNKILSILSPHFSCQKEAIFETFVAHLLFPSIINPICSSILYTKKYQENINIREKSNEKVPRFAFL